MKTPSPKFTAGFQKTAMHDVRDMPGQRKIFALNAKHPNYSKKGIAEMLKRRGLK